MEDIHTLHTHHHAFSLDHPLDDHGLDVHPLSELGEHHSLPMHEHELSFSMAAPLEEEDEEERSCSSPSLPPPPPPGPMLSEETNSIDSHSASNTLPNPMLIDESSNAGSVASNEGKFSSKNNKSMGCGKPGFITCSICNATKYYSHVQRRFGQFSCEPCSKFMKRFLRDPKVYTCVQQGECTIGRPSGEQEPRGVSVSRCKACWLRICLHKFVLDTKSKEVIEKYYAPRFAPATGSKSSKSPNTDFTPPKLVPDIGSSPIEAPPLPGASIRKRRTPVDADCPTKASNENNRVKSQLPSGARCTVRRVAARRKDYTRFELSSSATNKSSRKRKELFSQPGGVRRLKRAVLPNPDMLDDTSAPTHESFSSTTSAYSSSSSSFSSAFANSFSHGHVRVLDSPARSEKDLLDMKSSSIEFDTRTAPSTPLSDDNRIGEECGKCSQCTNGRSGNVLVVKECCKYSPFSKEKSPCWQDATSSFYTVDYYGGARAALSESIVRRARKDTHSPLCATDNDSYLYMRHSEFEKPVKKVKKKKPSLVGKDGLPKKSGFSLKKSSAFFTDYAFLNEILNANSPFL